MLSKLSELIFNKYLALPLESSYSKVTMSSLLKVPAINYVLPVGVESLVGSDLVIPCDTISKSPHLASSMCSPVNFPYEYG